MRRRNTLVILFAILTSAAPALALFDIQDPLTKRYNTESRLVIAGTITAVNAENHVLTVKPTIVYKGQAPGGESLQIQVYAPESLRTQAGAGLPVIVFKGAKSAAIHVADHWYLAESLEKPNQFRITARLSAAYDATFPGTTPSLLEALGEIKAGHSTLLDTFPKLNFPAPQKAATLPAHAVAFTALQRDDHPVTFFIATADGLKALELEPAGTLKDVTTDLALDHLKPTVLAAHIQAWPTANRRNRLLVDHVDYDQEANPPKFQKADARIPSDPFLAAAFEPSTHDLFTLAPQGLKRIPGEDLSPQEPTKASLPRTIDDDTRLTGARLTDYLKLPKDAFTAASMAFIDINHDGRPDLIIATPQGTLTLLNRGFGCYLVNKDFAAPLLDPAKTGKPAMPYLASTFILDENKNPVSILWALRDDGTLYRYDFPRKPGEQPK